MTGRCLAPIRPMIPLRNYLRKLSLPHRCIGRFERCKSRQGRRYRPALFEIAAPSMNRTPSKPLAALWMAGWLALMLIVVVAGREGMRELNVFQLMEMRTIIGFFLLYPMIRANGGFAVVKTARIHMHISRNLIHYCAQL